MSKSARDITAFEVILAIDGPFFITSCDTGTRSCDLTDHCTIKEPLRRVTESIGDVLKGIRISDLVEQDRHAMHGRGDARSNLLVHIGASA